MSGKNTRMPHPPPLTHVNDQHFGRTTRLDFRQFIVAMCRPAIARRSTFKVLDLDQCRCALLP
jgi:hypothetical protein